MSNSKTRAWFITGGIHVLVLLVLLLVKYQLPAQPVYQEELLEVDLGTEEDGFGDDQPEDVNAPAAPNTVSGENALSSNTSNNDNAGIENSDDIHAIAVNKNPSLNATKVINQPRVNKPNNAQTTNNNNRNNNNPSNSNAASNNTRSARYTYEGANGEGGNSASRNKPGGSQGDGSGTGDKGTPGGVVGGAYVSAVPNLTGRSLRTRPDPKATFNEGGTVVVRVTVDRSGKIIRHSIVRATNSNIQNIVLSKLKQVTFTESNNAPPEQSGTITFSFKTGKN